MSQEHCKEAKQEKLICELLKTSNTNGELLRILKKLVSEGYKLKAQHSNSEWKTALENAEEILINNK